MSDSSVVVRSPQDYCKCRPTWLCTDIPSLLPPTNGDALDLIHPLRALGCEFWILVVGIVDEASVVGVEGFGLDGASMFTDSFAQQGNALEKGPVPHATVELDIDNDPWGLLFRSALCQQDPVEQELEALQILIPASDQTLRILGPDLENEVPVTDLLLDLDKKTEVSEQDLKNFAGGLAHLSVSWGGGQRGKSQLFFVKLEPPFPFFLGLAFGAITWSLGAS